VKWPWLFASVCLAGCSLTDASGTKHTYILGFGVVSVNQTNSSASVYKSQWVGVAASDVPGVRFGVGYANTITVCVKSNAVVEVSDRPGSPMKVTAP
jgi:hypothetical protein